NVQPAAAGSYAVVIANAFGSLLSSNASLTLGQPPAISQQPASQTVAVGANASFTVTATGTAPLSCQWSVNGTNLPAATNSLLLLTNVQLTNAGSYAVVIANTFGSLLSSNAELTVGSPPAILVQPASQTVAVGGNASFTVTATGAPPLSYQWSVNGTNLPAATNSLLLLTNVQPAEAGNYAVSVANAFGSLLSSNASLTLGQPPAITQQPASQT